jgi:hypothetical protein
LAQHERRIEFTPVVPSTTDKRAWIDLMPGLHSSLVVEPEHGPKGPASIVHHLATEFLIASGTLLASPQRMSNSSLIATYDAIKRNWNGCKEMGEKQGESAG